MQTLNPAIVAELRTMAQQGASASQLLRSLHQRLSPEESHKLTVIKYMRQAFGLSLQEASPIAGWAPDGSGELSDAQLDEFVTPEISRHLASGHPKPS